MLQASRRRLLRQLSAIAAAALSGNGLLQSGRAAAGATESLWAHDAAGLRVARGPWPVPADLPPGVRFESIRLRMPDGVQLAGLLYLPTGPRRSVPA